ncbi:hypothetical protein ACE02P_17935 [Shewanella bicestrii]
MDAAYSFSFSGNPYQQRVPLLVREILFAFLAEANSASHPLVEHFGFDEKTFRFLRNCTPHSILRLASSYVRAGAIKFTVNEPLLKFLLRESINKESMSLVISSPLDSIYSHHSVVKELVMLMGDSLVFTSQQSGDFIDFGADIRRKMLSLDADSTIRLANSMVKNRCVQFSFNTQKIRDRTLSHMLFEKREAIKDLMVIKRATVGMMSRLFSEENEETHAARRFRLGFTATGRPRTCSEATYVDFILYWTSNPDLPELERFLEAHRKLGCSFDQLWTMYKRADSKGEFDLEVVTSINKTLERVARSVDVKS